MKILILILTVTLISACSHVAQFADSQDPCQDSDHLNRPQGYKTPSWCGASQGRVGIYNQRGQYQGYLK